MYKIELSGSVGNPVFKARSADHELLIDTKGAGMSPPDALLASLAGCVGVYINKYCEGSSTGLKDFSVTAEAEFSKEKPLCFRAISVYIDLKGAELDERRKYSLLQFLKNCPIHNTLKVNPQVDLKII